MKSKMLVMTVALVLTLTPTATFAQSNGARPIVVHQQVAQSRVNSDRDHQQQLMNWRRQGPSRIDRDIAYLNRLIIVVRTRFRNNPHQRDLLISQIRQRIRILMALKGRFSRDDYGHMSRDYNSITQYENGFHRDFDAKINGR